MVEVVLQPRNKSIADLIEQYRLKQITYAELYKAVGAMGYSTVSLYEMVRDVR